MPKAKSSTTLSLHKRGQWFVKRKGRQFYLGRDHDVALRKYLDGKDYYDAGLRPPEFSDGLTVADCCNEFLADAENRVHTHELSRETWLDYQRVAKLLVAILGRSTPVEDLRPSDFAKVRTKFAEGRSLVSLGNLITRARVILRHAETAELIEGRIRFGKAFDKPRKDVIRKAKANAPRRDLSASDIRKLLDIQTGVAAPIRLFVLLGINCAFGPSDIAQLPLEAIDLDTGWVTFPRPKTGIERRCQLWPETHEAITEYLKRRSYSNPRAARLLFINRYDNGFSRESVSNAFTKHRDACGLTCSHYDLRRTFRTVADEVTDIPAIDTIMGHADHSMGGRYRQGISDERLSAVCEHVHRWLFEWRR